MNKIVFSFAVLLVTSIDIASPRAEVAPENASPFDPHEIALMPHYCKYTQVYRAEVPGGNNPAEIARWERAMGPANGPGPVFAHMHHYCNAIFKTNRAVFGPKAEASIYLKSSLDEFDYVIHRAPDTFVLLPEILTKKAENLIRLTEVAPSSMRAGNAIEETLKRAIQLKHDYWPAYGTLSDHYKRLGQRSQARKILQDGLAAAPNAQALKRRLAALGG